MSLTQQEIHEKILYPVTRVGAGNAGGSPNPTNSKGGPGVQIPATYRGNGQSFGVNYYVAGGGGGIWQNGPAGKGGSGIVMIAYPT